MHLYNFPPGRLIIISHLIVNKPSFALPNQIVWTPNSFLAYVCGKPHTFFFSGNELCQLSCLSSYSTLKLPILERVGAPGVGLDDVLMTSDVLRLCEWYGEEPANSRPMQWAVQA